MSERDFRLYGADILESGIAILEYVKSLSYEEFQGDRKTYSAVIIRQYLGNEKDKYDSQNQTQKNPV